MLAEPVSFVRPVADLYRYERVAGVVSSPDALTREHFASYHRDGFLAVENVLTPSEVSEAREALRSLLHGEVAGYDGLQPEPEWKDKWPGLSATERADAVRKLWRFVEFSPQMKAFAVAHETIQSILTRLTGEPCDLIQDMALIKPPRVGSEKPWHQDMAYFSWGPPEKVLGV